MARLKYVGEGVYQGHIDGELRKIHKNAVFDVSEERAAKLKRDYPNSFQDTKDPVGNGDAPKPAAPGAGKAPVANKAMSTAPGGK
jgi:hypothetical protein